MKKHEFSFVFNLTKKRLDEIRVAKSRLENQADLSLRRAYYILAAAGFHPLEVHAEIENRKCLESGGGRIDGWDQDHQEFFIECGKVLEGIWWSSTHTANSENGGGIRGEPVLKFRAEARDIIAERR